MACSSCGTKSGGSCSPSGCKSNGNCGTGGCNALNVYDWFKDMELPEGFKPFDIVEVRFKGSRKEFFRNTQGLDLFTGDYVVVDSSIGFDIGTVSATGEIVRLQLKKYRVREDSDELPSIQRVATERDMEKYHQCKEREDDLLERARTIAFGLNLAMKISDIELQGDGRKVIFFYTAESRVDFRELIKKYAEEFRVKIEMRHISYREEASRLGGIGVCGRELCCSTWLTDYKQVNTGAARVQNLSINMEKLAGQCGRLKCCLNFELDMYMEAVEAFPKAKIVKLDTVGGMAFARKTDILKKLIWFSYDDSQTWVPLPVDKVNELMEQNKEGKQVANLTDLAPANAILEKVVNDQNNDFIDNSELLRDDEFKDLGRGNSRGNNRNSQNRGQNNSAVQNRGGHSGNSQNRNRNPRNERGPSDRNNRPENNSERSDRGPAERTERIQRSGDQSPRNSERREGSNDRDQRNNRANNNAERIQGSDARNDRNNDRNNQRPRSFEPRNKEVKSGESNETSNTSNSTDSNSSNSGVENGGNNSNNRKNNNRRFDKNRRGNNPNRDQQKGPNNTAGPQNES
jgi:cell fate regulator YaaT (PSP1 superfamily)